MTVKDNEDRITVGTELLEIDEMYAADRFAIESGITGEHLMEAAGKAVADEITRRWALRPITILCGPGNNGGDGFVVARLLKARGWPVTLGLLGEVESLGGDARINAEKWDQEIYPVSVSLLEDAGIVVDALFGAGLVRPIESTALEVIQAIGKQPCVSIDIPSGIHGDTGLVLGAAPQADLTVTFFRRKPGHLLLPGRTYAGRVVVADIGIPDTALQTIQPLGRVNEPALWGQEFPWPHSGDHKYTRGHALIMGGPTLTGAARLAARAARRAGAGLVTVAASPESLPVYAADAPGLLTEPFATAEEFDALLEDERRNVVLVGPGCGVNRTTQDAVLAAAGRRRPVVLDADALTVFADQPGRLFAGTRATPSVITPHEGEYSRLFRFTGSKLERARKAAELSGAVVLLKGADTVIAAPDGRAGITENAPPTLATAGSGDVLAGLITGLLAQGMPPFEAGCAGAWLHGEAASDFGPGLIAEDICERLPAVLSRLAAEQRGLS